MRIILLGAPGAGKGSVGKPLSKQLGIPVISTGDIFRKNISENTKLGQTVKSYMEKGALVPDELTVKVLEERLLEENCSKGFILDGFPRNIFQGEKLDDFLNKDGKSIDVVLNVHLDDDIIINRISNRQVCEDCGATYNKISHISQKPDVCDKCGGHLIVRADDSSDIVKERIKTYYKQTKPLINYYKKRGILVTMENDSGVEEGALRAFAAIEHFKNSEKNDELNGVVK